MSYDQKKGGSQIGNLIFDHKPLESRGQIGSDWGMLYTIEKILFEGHRILPSHFQNKFHWRRYKHPKF
jgi:hypothetical protein